VKFSVKSIYPISTTSHSNIWLVCWESAPVGVIYLWAIMGDRSLHGGQKTEDNDDFRYIRYIGFYAPNSKSQIETRSGRFKSKMLYRNKTGKISGQILTPASPKSEVGVF
jgi:hypothetical protein